MPEMLDPRQSASQDLRFAVIGFGKMGILHSSILNLLNPNCVKAVIDNSRLLSLIASKILKNVTFYKDFNTALKKDAFNAVYITTPVQSHFSILSKLLETDTKYIFVEKPPTINLSQLTMLLDKIDNNQVIMAGLQKKFSFPFRHAKALVSEKVIGEIEKVYAYIRSSDISMPSSRFNSIGKGVNLDLGIHLIDLLVWMFNLNTVENARCRAIYTCVDDYFEAKLRNDSGVECNVEITWSNPDYRLPETYIEVCGSKGKLKVTEDYLKALSEGNHQLLNDQKEITLYKPHYYQNTPPVNLADPEYTLEDAHFLYSISSSMKPITDLRNLTQTMALLDEMYKKAGSPISSIS